MSYRVEFTSAAKKQLKKMDRFDASLILSWIEKNLEGCVDPPRVRQGSHGEPHWRMALSRWVVPRARRNRG